MKHLFSLLLVLGVLAASCSSPSSELRKRQVPARVHEAIYSTADGKYHALELVYIRNIDTLCKPGDVIELGNSTYIVDSFTVKPVHHD